MLSDWLKRHEKTSLLSLLSGSDLAMALIKWEQHFRFLSCLAALFYEDLDAGFSRSESFIVTEKTAFVTFHLPSWSFFGGRGDLPGRKGEGVKVLRICLLFRFDLKSAFLCVCLWKEMWHSWKKGKNYLLSFILMYFVCARFLSPDFLVIQRNIEFFCYTTW